MMRLMSLLGLSLVLAGCASGSSGYYTQSVQSWRGANIKDVVKVWGSPDETMMGAGGKTVYVFKRQSFVNTNATYSPGISIVRRNGSGIPVIASTPNINSPASRGYATYCLAVFTATPAGKIVDTNIQGTNCYISQSAAQQLTNPK